MLEIIDSQKAVTPFLQYGDKVEIEVLDKDSRSVFGRIEQVVKPKS